jgi:hypothetical protein
MSPVPTPCHDPVPARAWARALPVPAHLAQPESGGLTCNVPRNRLAHASGLCHLVPAVPGWFR